ISLVKLVKGEGATRRTKPIPFNCFGETAIVDGNWKLLQVGKGKNAKKQKYELYDLKSDPKESNNLFAAKTEVAMRMQAYMRDWLDSLERSQKGLDYPEQEVRSGEPQPRFWMDVKEYEPYFDAWRQRPEYRSRLKDK
ncbi:MAG: N-acetylgalactosamine 6-sulfate sulfatase, partial [Planctomycetota bacterium]